MERLTPADKYDAFGDLLKAYVDERRTAMGCSMAVVARRLGVERQTMYKWFDGTSTIRIDTLLRLFDTIMLPTDKCAQLLALYSKAPMAQLSKYLNQEQFGDLMITQEAFISQEVPASTWVSFVGAIAHLQAQAGENPPLLPTVQSLPPRSWMNLPRYHHFTGRADELWHIAIHFQRQALHPTVVLNGLAGVGKTQLAVEFTYRFGQYFAGGVYWINCRPVGADHENLGDAIKHQIAGCGHAMRLAPHFDQFDLDTQVRLVAEAWTLAIPRLVVFDNCNDPQIVDEWRPTQGGTYWLITSLHSRWDAILGEDILVVDTLSPEESQHLLRRLAPSLSSQEAALIAKTLSYFPLALHLAGHFMKEYGAVLSAAMYVQELEAALISHRSMQATEAVHAPTSHELCLKKTFEMSYKQLDKRTKRDGLAVKLLVRAAQYHAGIPIPYTFLEDISELASEDHIILFMDSIRRLTDLGLITISASKMIILHTLISDFVTKKITVSTCLNERMVALECAYRELARCTESNSPVKIREYHEQLSHIIKLLSTIDSPLANEFYTQFGYYLFMESRYNDAKQFLSEGLARWKSSTNGEHELATTLDYLGLVSLDLNEYDNASAYLWRAYSVRCESATHDDMLMATTINNLGLLEYKQERHDRAEFYYKVSIMMRVLLFGEWHQDVAEGYNNIGLMFQETEQYDEAVFFIEKSIEIRKRTLGELHPRTANSYNSLGIVYYWMKAYDKCLQPFIKSLKIKEKIMADDHPDIAIALNNLGMSYYREDDMKGAQKNLEKALLIYQKHFGDTHIDTAKAYGNLGAIYLRLGMIGKSKRYLDQALALKQEVLPPDHSSIGMTYEVLGDWFTQQDRLEDARTAHHKALKIFLQAFGTESDFYKDVAKKIQTLL